MKPGLKRAIKKFLRLMWWDDLLFVAAVIGVHYLSQIGEMQKIAAIAILTVYGMLTRAWVFRHWIRSR
jgi:hypothetical protein